MFSCQKKYSCSHVKKGTHVLMSKKVLMSRTEKILAKGVKIGVANGGQSREITQFRECADVFIYAPTPHD